VIGFFGILSGKEAKAIMKKEIQKKKKGTFLVRCNDRLDYKNYPFIVSVVTGKPQSKSIIHYKILLEIKEEKRLYTVKNGSPSPKLIDLINFEETKTLLKLTNPSCGRELGYLTEEIQSEEKSEESL